MKGFGTPVSCAEGQPNQAAACMGGGPITLRSSEGPHQMFSARRDVIETLHAGGDEIAVATGHHGVPGGPHAHSGKKRAVALLPCAWQTTFLNTIGTSRRSG